MRSGVCRLIHCTLPTVLVTLLSCTDESPRTTSAPASGGAASGATASGGAALGGAASGGAASGALGGAGGRNLGGYSQVWLGGGGAPSGEFQGGSGNRGDVGGTATVSGGGSPSGGLTSAAGGVATQGPIDQAGGSLPNGSGGVGPGKGGASGGAGELAGAGGGAPLALGSVHGYLTMVWSYAAVRVDLEVKADQFRLDYWAHLDSGWRSVMELQGSVASVSSNRKTLQLERIRLDDERSSQTFLQGTADFASTASHVWGLQPQLQVDWTPSQGQGVLTPVGPSAVLLPSVFSSENRDQDYAEMIGAYPACQYTGLGFYGSPLQLSSHSQFYSAFAGTVTESAVTVEDPAGAQNRLSLVWEDDRQEWGGQRSSGGTNPTAGLWFVRSIEAKTDRGAQVTCSRETPYSPLRLVAVTTAGYHGERLTTAKESESLLAQDYVSPVPPLSGYTVEVFRNPISPSGARVDPALYVYSEDDVLRWKAANDDGGTDELMPALRFPFEAKKRYFIRVHDIYSNGGAYSIRITADGQAGGGPVAVSNDAYEPDNSSAEAKAIVLDQWQHHLLSVGDNDWFEFTAP